MISPTSAAYLLSWIFVSSLPGLISSTAVVTLDSCVIFTTHEWFKSKPTVYFQCKGENRVVLPDVKEPHVLYAYKGQESWQPLTNFTSEKCKRCGLYEADTVPPDDTFDEWELCPSDFSESNGKYTRVKEKEFNATFLCPECTSLSTNSTPSSNVHKQGKSMHVGLIITITMVVFVAFIIGSVVAYKYWMKRRREQEQARFLKLFEEHDDIEDELGLDI